MDALKDEALDTLTVRSLVTQLPQSSAMKAFQTGQQLSAA